MVSFRIIVRGHKDYWIEAAGEDGSRRFFERCDSEAEANERLRELSRRADYIERRINPSGDDSPPAKP